MEDPVRLGRRMGPGPGPGEGLRISVVRSDKPLPAMPDDSEATPVGGGLGWKNGDGELDQDGSRVSWVEMDSKKSGDEEPNCEY